jgi:hypothetical protein
MSTKWPKVKLGEVLRQRKEFVIIDDLATYKRPRVKLHGVEPGAGGFGGGAWRLGVE